jgi:hypothetical protein
MKTIIPPNIARLMEPTDLKHLGATTPEQDQEKREKKAEKELQEQACALLNRYSVVYLRPAMFRKTQLPPGWPDVIFVYWGKPFAWEFKVEKPGTVRGEPRPEQVRMLNALAGNGWNVSIIRSLEQAQTLLFEAVPEGFEISGSRQDL